MWFSFHAEPYRRSVDSAEIPPNRHVLSGGKAKQCGSVSANWIFLSETSGTMRVLTKETPILRLCFSFPQSPLRSRRNSQFAERGQSFQSSCSSLPREARVQAIPRAKGSPVHTYKSVEITNI